MSRLDDFLNAISAQESGGSYTVVNRNTGALGRFQVMPGNVGPWAKRYLGITLSPSQFLRSPAMQDRLVRAVMSSYVSKYGYRGAAAAWYSGNPALADNYNPQRYGPSIGSYVDSVMGRMNQSPFSAAIHLVADEATLAATKAVQSLPGFKPDPIEKQQDHSTFAPNPVAQDRKEPSAVKGLGLDIQDGSGAGQLGMEAGTGPDQSGTNGLGIDIQNANLEQPSTTGRDTLSEILSAPSGSGSNSSQYVNPVAGYKPEGAWGTYPESHGKHLALDFAVPVGTKVGAPMAGTVVSAGWEDGGFGYAVRIRNIDGTYTILGHLSKIDVRPGMTVKPGQIVAASGSSGRSTGPHLHLEMRRSLYDPSTSFDFSKLFTW